MIWDSWISFGSSLRSGLRVKMPEILSTSTGTKGAAGIDAFLDDLEGSIALEGDDVADLAEVGSDVDFLAVDEDVPVVDELTGRGAGAGEAHAVDEVVEAGFEDAEEREARDGFLVSLGKDEQAAELTLVDAIEGAKLLLLEELLAVFGRLALAVLAVLARTIGSLLQFITGLESGETKVTALFPRATSVSRHVSCLLSRAKRGVPLPFPGCPCSVRASSLALLVCGKDV